MRVIPEPIVFEWDEGNKEKNYLKHKITAKQAEEVFGNDPKFTFPDRKHSKREKRFGIFGETNDGMLLSEVFTIRGNKIRIITVRHMSQRERRVYEKIKKVAEL